MSFLWPRSVWGYSPHVGWGKTEHSRILWTTWKQLHHLARRLGRLRIIQLNFRANPLQHKVGLCDKSQPLEVAHDAGVLVKTEGTTQLNVQVARRYFLCKVNQLGDAADGREVRL